MAKPYDFGIIIHVEFAIIGNETNLRMKVYNIFDKRNNFKEDGKDSRMYYTSVKENTKRSIVVDTLSLVK